MRGGGSATWPWRLRSPSRPVVVTAAHPAALAATAAPVAPWPAARRGLPRVATPAAAAEAAPPVPAARPGPPGRVVPQAGRAAARAAVRAAARAAGRAAPPGVW